MYQCSLIIAFYNRPDYLALVLAGLARQTMNDYEVIIADDGSDEETLSQLQENGRSSLPKICSQIFSFTISGVASAISQPIISRSRCSKGYSLLYPLWP